MQAAIAVRADYAEAYFMLGTALKQKGDLPAAEAALQRRSGSIPRIPALITRWRQFLRQTGELEESRQLFAKARASNRPRSPNWARGCGSNGPGESLRGRFLRSPFRSAPSHRVSPRMSLRFCSNTALRAIARRSRALPIAHLPMTRETRRADRRRNAAAVYASLAPRARLRRVCGLAPPF